MLSVASSCDHNEIFKNGKNRLQTNARPSGAIPTNPHPQAKARMQKPQGWGKFLVQIPGGARRGGGMVMDEIDTCIIDLLLLMSNIKFYSCGRTIL